MPYMNNVHILSLCLLVIKSLSLCSSHASEICDFGILKLDVNVENELMYLIKVEAEYFFRQSFIVLTAQSVYQMIHVWMITCSIFVNGSASLRWSFGPHSVWSSKESTTILTPVYFLQLLNLSSHRLTR